jgi:hypothetical protein
LTEVSPSGSRFVRGRLAGRDGGGPLEEINDIVLGVGVRIAHAVGAVGDDGKGVEKRGSCVVRTPSENASLSSASGSVSAARVPMRPAGE